MRWLEMVRLTAVLVASFSLVGAELFISASSWSMI
jgi:hypothetical protein